MDGVDIVRTKAELFPGQIEHLPADHAVFTGGLRQNADDLHYDRRLRVCAGGRLKRRRQQRVPGQNSVRFAENLVICQPSAPVIVIVHARKIVVDQAVGVYHFNCSRERQRPAPVSAAQSAEFQRQHRADALASGQQAVAHGLKQLPLRAGLIRKAVFEIFLDRAAVDFHRFLVLTHLSYTPFLPVRRRRPSSASRPEAPPRSAFRRRS